MAGHIYGYGVPQSQATATASLTEPYFPATMASSDPSKFSAAMYLSQADAYTAASRTASHLASLASWSAAAAASDDGSASGIKRTSEALYHPSVNTIGQEAWYTTSALAKRYRYENASHLPVYPQRPGEKDCAHYMITRTCKFGDTCRFDHPVWVPEGGIPDWKEVLPVTSEALPERPGQLDCPYFLKTQRCKFGLRCKFNHPKETLAATGGSENGEVTGLPERPSETPCAFYLKTGICKFGSTCKFHHPKDVQLPSAVQDIGCVTQHDAAKTETLKPGISFVPAMYYNSKELPIRPGEPECPFYLKTFSCKYGATCRYTHPDINAMSMIPSAASLGHALVASSPAAAMGLGVVNPVASLYQTIDPRIAQATMALASGVYPQRPGQLECDFYMKTGECRFGERCRFHHPYDRTPSQSTMLAQQQSVKLTLAGLPRREGSINCPYYLKTGTCKYGTTCKFDHPPPGEVMAKTEGKTNDAE